MAEQQQDVDTLKRRGRRRLVGAVALVLLAVIILPMVFDPEPRPVAPPVSVRIPGEDETPFKPKPPAQKPMVAEKQVAEKQVAEKQAAEKQAAEKQAAEKKQAGKEEYVVPVGAYASFEGVTGRLAAAGIPYFTEPAQGNLTRVRAGPFPTREAAEQAAAKLKDLGLQPGTVATK
jgi:DedD protein